MVRVEKVLDTGVILLFDLGSVSGFNTAHLLIAALAHEIAIIGALAPIVLPTLTCGHVQI